MTDSNTNTTNQGGRAGDRVNVTSGALKNQLENAKVADTTREGAGFVQQQGQSDLIKLQCYRCGKFGHVASKCTEKMPQQGTANVKTEEQGSNGADTTADDAQPITQEAKFANIVTSTSLMNYENTMWTGLHLDTQSSVHICGNDSYLSKIKQFAFTHQRRCIETNRQGLLPGIGLV